MIRFDHLSKVFHLGGQEVHALEEISLDIQDGDIFGVIGFSGAGKSTLLRMVNALERPTGGRVEINGQDIGKLSFAELRKVRKKIGMIFQQFNLLNSKTVYDNVAIPLVLNRVPKDEIERKVSRLLSFVELSDKRDAFPAQLSGGQCQRVGIARALATDPSILLCDEATSALDPETTEAILQLLEKVNAQFGITILVVTHEIQVIQKICNRVAVMEHGRLVETGSVLDVFSNPRQAMTRRFVQTVIPDRIPQSLLEELRRDTRNCKVLRLRFLGQSARENLLYDINRNYGVETSVLFASVSELQKTVLGIFIVQVLGSDEEILRVIRHIEEKGIPWQEVSL